MGTNVKMKATAYLRTEGTLTYYMHTAILCTFTRFACTAVPVQIMIKVKSFNLCSRPRGSRIIAAVLMLPSPLEIVGLIIVVKSSWQNLPAEGFERMALRSSLLIPPRGTNPGMTYHSGGLVVGKCLIGGEMEGFPPQASNKTRPWRVSAGGTISR
jgi:hypothetical protein